MEYVEAEELFDKILNRGTFTEETAADVMRQIFDAINYCHSKKIVHRNLKPENILIYESPDKSQLFVKVKDFRIAETVKSKKMLKETIGSAYYMSPEVISGSYTEKCDLWSCGVILYMLLSGTPPFNGSTDDEIIREIKAGNFSFNGKFLY